MQKPRMILGISNAKTSKGESLGYLTGILYLKPAKSSGTNLCPKSTDGCEKACLESAGRGGMKSVSDARMNKTLMYIEDRLYFYQCLMYSIKRLVKMSKNKNMLPAVRLNGTSDILWEYQMIDGKHIMDHFPDVQFYDYTAVINRKAINFPIKNYHLTFSRKETRDNHKDCEIALTKGVNVAVVYRDKNKAVSRGAIDGDQHDLRFLNKSQNNQGLIIALSPKGKAKKDTTGFVINN